MGWQIALALVGTFAVPALVFLWVYWTAKGERMGVDMAKAKKLNASGVTPEQLKECGLDDADLKAAAGAGISLANLLALLVKYGPVALSIIADIAAMVKPAP